MRCTTQQRCDYQGATETWWRQVWAQARKKLPQWTTFWVKWMVLSVIQIQSRLKRSGLRAWDKDINKHCRLILMRILTSTSQCTCCTPLGSKPGRKRIRIQWDVSQVRKRINAFRSGKCHWSQIVSTESVVRLKSSFSFPFLSPQHSFRTWGVLHETGEA